VTLLTQLKLGFTTIGLLMFGYGYRVEDARIRWIGIAFVALAFGLRFAKRDKDAEAPPE
jgi:hypothetical protein